MLYYLLISPRSHCPLRSASFRPPSAPSHPPAASSFTFQLFGGPHTARAHTYQTHATNIPDTCHIPGARAHARSRLASHSHGLRTHTSPARPHSAVTCRSSHLRSAAPTPSRSPRPLPAAAAFASSPRLDLPPPLSPPPLPSRHPLFPSPARHRPSFQEPPNPMPSKPP